MALNLKLGNAVRNAADKAAQSRSTDGFLAPGEEIEVSSSPYASMDALTLRGFASLEEDGIWSSGAVARVDVRMRGAKPDHRYRVAVGVMLFEGPGHRALVAISVNGGPPKQITGSSGGWLQIEVDCQLDKVGRSPGISLEFQVANPMSPTTLNLGDDSRLLGFKLRSIRVVDPALTPLGSGAAAGGEQSRADVVNPLGIDLKHGTPAPASVPLSARAVTLLRSLAGRGPRWRALLIDRNPAVRGVRWLRRVTRSLQVIQQQLDLIRLDSARQSRELAQRVNAIESGSNDLSQQRQLEADGAAGALQQINMMISTLHAEQQSHQAMLQSMDAVDARMRALEDRMLSVRTGDGGFFVAPEVSTSDGGGDAVGAATAAELITAAHAKLDDLGGQARQVLEMLVAAHQKLDIQQQKLQMLNAPTNAPRRVLRTRGGWLVSTGFGTFSCDERDDLLAMCLAEYGDVEKGLRLYLQETLLPGDTFVDAGANIGLHTVVAARAVGQDGLVVAVEAMPRTVAHLQASLRLSTVEDRVSLHACAAGARAEDGHVFHVAAVAGHSSLYPLDEAVIEEVRVNIRPLDGMVPPGKVKLVKIDVEGAELDVIAGMSRLIAENPDIGIIAEYAQSHLLRVGTRPEQWEQMRAEHGFDLYLIDDLTGRCEPLQGFAEIHARVSSNVLLCRPGSGLAWKGTQEALQ